SRPEVAEIAAAGWELFSALLFITAVLPAAAQAPLPPLIFLASLALSSALSRRLTSRGARGYDTAAAIRAISWPLAVAPLVGPGPGPRLLVAAFVFGLMAAVIRRALYRLLLDPALADLDDAALGASLEGRVAESASTAGIVGGHVMLLFSVAFLRVGSQV